MFPERSGIANSSDYILTVSGLAATVCPAKFHLLYMDHIAAPFPHRLMAELLMREACEGRLHDPQLR